MGLVAIRPPVNLLRGGLTVRVRLTTVRLTRLGVALDVDCLARLAGADLVVRVRVVLFVARPFVDVRPRLVERRELVELLRLELLRLDERDFERPFERPRLDRPRLDRPPRPPRPRRAVSVHETSAILSKISIIHLFI